MDGKTPSPTFCGLTLLGVDGDVWHTPDTPANEMNLAANLIDTTPDHSLTLFDKVFYSLGLLNHCSEAGSERHWLFEVV